jgi:hypothetical protein
MFLTLLNGQVSSYAIRDVEEYKNFCDRPKDQRPLPEEVLGVRLNLLLCCLLISMVMS